MQPSAARYNHVWPYTAAIYGIIQADTIIDSHTHPYTTVSAATYTHIQLNINIYRRLQSRYCDGCTPLSLLGPLFVELVGECCQIVLQHKAGSTLGSYNHIWPYPAIYGHTNHIKPYTALDNHTPPYTAI